MHSIHVPYASTGLPLCPALVAPRPLGFWGTIAATALALAMAFVAAVAMALAFRISHTTDKDLFKQVGFVGFLLVFFAIILLVCRGRGWRAIDYLALTKPQGRYARDGAAALVLAWAVSAAVILFYVIGDYKFPTISVLSIPSTISGLCIMLIGIVILAPIGEELFFRGFLYRGFAASPLGAAGAIVLTDLIWTAGHLYKPSLGLASTFFTGLLLGWLRWRTGSIIPTIALHTLNNAVVGLVIAGVTLGRWTVESPQSNSLTEPKQVRTVTMRTNQGEYQQVESPRSPITPNLLTEPKHVRTVTIRKDQSEQDPAPPVAGAPAMGRFVGPGPWGTIVLSRHFEGKLPF